MAIQMRRGNYADFDASKMVAGEFGICLDNGYVYITLSAGNAVRLGTADTIEDALALVQQYSESASQSADNASASATSSGESAVAAETNAENAEAWAVGKRSGIDVEEDDDTYHNNAKYYAEQAEHFSENATYLYIRYSQYSDGTDFTTTPQANTKYIGIYSGSSSTAPTDKTAYNWVKFVGQDGTGGAISDLTDVALSQLQDEQILRYDATLGKWVNADNSGGGGNDVGLSIVSGEINVTYDPDGTRVKEPLCLDETLQGVNNTLGGIKDAIQSTVGMQPATTTKLGGIKVGDNLSITSDGKLSATATPYTLPTASSSTLGGIKVGSNLSISNGVLSTHAPYTLPTASYSTLGGVRTDSSRGITVNSSGYLELLRATRDYLGGVKIPDYSGINLDSSGNVSLSRQIITLSSVDVYLNVASRNSVPIASDEPLTKAVCFDASVIPSGYSGKTIRLLSVLLSDTVVMIPYGETTFKRSSTYGDYYTVRMFCYNPGTDTAYIDSVDTMVFLIS